MVSRLHRKSAVVKMTTPLPFRGIARTRPRCTRITRYLSYIAPIQCTGDSPIQTAEGVMMATPSRGTQAASWAAILLTLMFALLATGCDTFQASEGDGFGAAETVTGPATAFKITDVQDSCTLGTQSSGALFEVCVPDASEFNGVLVVYAHGFVFPQAPLAVPDDQLGGVPAKEIIVGQGFAYAATSYYTNGLVDPQEGLKDLRELIVIFNNVYGRTLGRAQQVILVGFSNGAFLSTVALEKQAGLFDGALASCGPIGDYHRQIEYYGDVLVLFQFFYPGIIEGGPDGMPQSTIDWAEANLAAAVGAALLSDPVKAQQFFAILAGTSAIVGADPLTGALPPLDAVTIGELAEALVAVLRYAIFPVNDAIEKLNGSPYGNLDRMYGDLLGAEFAALVAAVNQGVARFEPDRGALAQLEARFKTHGNLKAPLVALHNLFDPIVPFWQETLYEDKLSGRAEGVFHLNPVPVSEPVGHCDFSAAELFGALAVLQQAIGGPIL